MKLYTYSPAPSPMRVELMLRYKGVSLDAEQVDLRNGAQMQEPFRSLNPRCMVPALLLDDGSLLTEVIAICVYLDSQYPQKSVFGSNEIERAQVISWMHRIFTDGFLACAEALRNSSPGMKHRALPGPENIEQIPALAERGLQRLPYFFADLDAHLADRQYIVGNSLSQADIDAYVVSSFSGWVKASPDESLSNLQRWKQHLSELLE